MYRFFFKLVATKRKAKEIFEKKGFTVSLNVPYSGGFITTHYGAAFSKRGGVALHESLKCLNDKCNVSITPDGPRGPRYRMSRGPVIMASKTGVPVLPIAVNYSSYWEAKSWDKFQVPKPWAKVTLLLGDPINIPPDLSDEEMEEWRRLLEQKLNAISDKGK